MRTKCNLQQCRTYYVTTPHHVLKVFKVRRDAQSPVHYLGLPTLKSNGTETLATAGTVDGCSVLPETQLVGTRLRVDTTRVLSVGGPFPNGSCLRESIKPPLGDPLLTVHQCYLLKSFSQGDTSARQWGF